MRHFDFLGRDDRDRLFVREPEAFPVGSDPERLGVSLGATLYCPATRPQLARDIARRAAHGVVSLVVCLEDSVPDAELATAELNAVTQLRELSRSGAAAP